MQSSGSNEMHCDFGALDATIITVNSDSLDAAVRAVYIMCPALKVALEQCYTQIHTAVKWKVMRTKETVDVFDMANVQHRLRAHTQARTRAYSQGHIATLNWANERMHERIITAVCEMHTCHWCKIENAIDVCPTVDGRALTHTHSRTRIACCLHSRWRNACHPSHRLI